ncbi:hypothetical protein [uncultured Devosia sp.]|uniref:hypothetical protein n=1 Tax=uncultured Devosia sp. TaxID=211434 RepID=UPI0035C99F35
MAQQLMALGLNDFKGNALGAFAQGQQHAMDQKTQQLEHAKQNFGYLAQMAHDAQGDPAAWDAGLDAMEASGWSPDQLARFRGRADLAPILARSALTAEQELSNNFNQQQLDMSRQRLAFDMTQAAAGPKPTSNMIEYGAAQEQGYDGTLADWMSEGSSSAPTYGTTVLTGRDAEGNVVPLQAGSSGGMVQSQLPPGVSFDPGALNAERAAGNVIGKGAGQAAIDLPSAQAEAQRIAIQISDLKSHPGLEEIFGKTLGVIPNQWGPTMPGSNKANAMARIDQMTGNAFLNGRQLLKGGGAITEMESNKAEAAFARLSTAQSKDEFIAGLNDFQAALDAGIAKLADQSGNTGFSSGTVSPAGQQPMGDDPLGMF